MWKQKVAQVIPIVISSTGVIPKSLSQSLTRLKLHPITYIHTTAKICNSWHVFNCKKLFKLQIRPPSIILLITTSQDRWIFHSQSWEVRNLIIIIRRRRKWWWWWWWWWWRRRRRRWGGGYANVAVGEMVMTILKWWLDDLWRRGRWRWLWLCWRCWSSYDDFEGDE